MVRVDTKCLHCGNEWGRYVDNPKTCVKCHTKTPNNIIDIATGKVIQGYTYNDTYREKNKKRKRKVLRIVLDEPRQELKLDDNNKQEDKFKLGDFG